ncbi:IS3 family transposase [Klebsiella pneumoniae]
MKTQPATGETYPKSDLFNKAIRHYNTRRISLKFKGLSPVEYRLKSYPGRN